MAIMAKRRYRCRESATIRLEDVALLLLCCISVVMSKTETYLNMQETRKNIERSLKENLKLDKGKGCALPSTDPFSSEATQFNVRNDVIKCPKKKDWVKCHYSNCKVVKEIEHIVENILCEIQDIIYESDAKYSFSPTTVNIIGDETYELNMSDHIKVTCNGEFDHKEVNWTGNTIGFRKIEPEEPPPGRENTFNVLLFILDSTARNGFIRLMPKSWKVLTEELGATVMEGYNIVGTATPAAIIPILTGHTELELPDARKSQNDSQNVDAYPLLFYKLKKDGYRTAYFEDSPNGGTFQWRLRGWRHQPADHYLRPFLVEEGKKNIWYCVGNTPEYKLVMNITEQFMKLDGKRFVFTFIGDITHDNFNMVQIADDDMAAFLRAIKIHSEDTLIVVMGDHGPRLNNRARPHTLQGKFEERQPLMALRLPGALVRARPAALAALQANARALTTPHDLHATLLDVLEMTHHWNQYSVPGADLPRGLTMLEPIPRNRSCSEAGIEPQWCACVALQNVSSDDPLYDKTAYTLLDFVNNMTRKTGTPFYPRTLRSVTWMRRERPNTHILAFKGSADPDGFTGIFSTPTNITEDKYHTKIVVGPGHDVLEASLTYLVKKKLFLIKEEDIVWSKKSSKFRGRRFGHYATSVVTTSSR